MAFWPLILIVLPALLLLGQIMALGGDACLAVADPRRQVFANDELIKPGLIWALGLTRNAER